MLAALPVGMLVAEGIDLLIDGLLVGLGATLGARQGLIITIALTLEILFLSLSLAAEFREAGLSERRAVLLCTGLGLLTAVGAITGAAVLAGAGSATLAAVLAWDVETHRALAREPSMANLCELTHVQSTALALTRVLLNAAVARDVVDQAPVRAHVEPRLAAAQCAWGELHGTPASAHQAPPPRREPRVVAGSCRTWKGRAIG